MQSAAEGVAAQGLNGAPRTGLIPARWLWPSTLAGAAAPLLFLAVALVQVVLRPDHDAVALPISALSVGPAGWVQDVNFVGCGLLIAAFAPGLHALLRPAPMGAVGPALVAVMGAGFVAAGLLPAVDDAGRFSQDEPGHAVAAGLMLVGAVLGPLVLARRMAADPAWRDLAAASRWMGVLLLVLAGGFLLLARPPGASLHGGRGLFVWAILVALGAWLVLLSWRGLRVAGVRPASNLS